MRAVFVLVLAVFLGLAAVGCGGGETKEAEPETVEGTVPAETGGETGETGETGEDDGGGGGGAEGDPAAGEEIYTSAGCGSCHVLEAAGSSGTAGPNLDEAKPSQDEAVEQIANGGGGMPAFKDQLSEKEIADVAAFVVESAGG